jgi:hypothetical protein
MEQPGTDATVTRGFETQRHTVIGVIIEPALSRIQSGAQPEAGSAAGDFDRVG